jgi:hypothetical protein
MRTNWYAHFVEAVLLSKEPALCPPSRGEATVSSSPPNFAQPVVPFSKPPFVKLNVGPAVAVAVAGRGDAVADAGAGDAVAVAPGGVVLVGSTSVGVNDGTTVKLDVAVALAVAVAVSVAVGVGVASAGPSRLTSSTQVRVSPVEVVWSSTLTWAAPAGALALSSKVVQVSIVATGCVIERVRVAPAPSSQRSVA